MSRFFILIDISAPRTFISFETVTSPSEAVSVPVTAEPAAVKEFPEQVPSDSSQESVMPCTFLLISAPYLL